MVERTPSISAEAKALKEAYAALNRNDIAGFVRDFDSEIVRIEPDGFPSAGIYRGIAAVKEHLSQGRSTWAEGSCEPERFVVAGDKVVVSLHVRVRLKGKTDWIDGRFADVYTFRDGKAIQFRTFGEEREALEWAGVQPSDSD